MYYEFRLGDLYEIKDELIEIEITIDNISEVIDYQQSEIGDATDGNFSASLLNDLDIKSETIEAIYDNLQEMIFKIDEIIDIIETSDLVYNQNMTFIFDPDVFEQKINVLKTALDMNGIMLKSIIELDYSYQDWETNVSRKLDNQERGITDLIEEVKQNDDELVFRHNREIMQAIQGELLEIINHKFINAIDEIEIVKKSLEELNLLDEVTSIEAIFTQRQQLGTPIIDNSEHITVDNMQKIYRD